MKVFLDAATAIVILVAFAGMFVPWGKIFPQTDVKPIHSRKL
jgi:hypothetical protein